MDEPPFCLCIAGPNGSGKSTITKSLRNKHQLTNWIDPDVIAAETAATACSDVTPRISACAMIRARELRVLYAKGRQDFAFETVFSHGSNVAFLKILRALGYRVFLYFVCTESPQINVARVQQRVERGGHNVEPDKIFSRYVRSLECLELAITVAERTFLFDNSKQTTGVRNQMGRLVGDYHNVSITPELRLWAPVPSWTVWNAVNPLSAGWMFDGDPAIVEEAAFDICEGQDPIEAALAALDTQMAELRKVFQP